jgi:hypothetical protein
LLDFLRKRGFLSAPSPHKSGRRERNISLCSVPPRRWWVFSLIRGFSFGATKKLPMAWDEGCVGILWSFLENPYESRKPFTNPGNPFGQLHGNVLYSFPWSRPETLSKEFFTIPEAKEHVL